MRTVLEWNNLQLAGVHPNSVGIILWAQPFWQDARSLDKEEFAVTIRYSCPKVGKYVGEFTEDIDDQPLVFYAVPIVGDAAEAM